MVGTETVAVLGAGGPVGLPMARNITRAGIQVRAWDSSRENVMPLAEDGAYIADSPADAARGADPSGRYPAEDPYGSDHALWVQMNPVGETATRRCEGLANQRGVGFVDAPVEAGEGTRLKEARS